ncbi:MAG: WG repeat-containing protein, partial [Eubacteriales bacterium]|nr:WG repeat-containing protein [Eubacteriales bacterium]
MESRQPNNNHGNTGKKGKHSLLSLYGYTLCLLLLGAVVFGLTYSAGGANVLKEEELRKAEEEAAAIEAAKPTPTPRAVSTATAGRLIPFLENSLWGYKNTSGEIVILPAFSAANEFDGNVAFAAKDGLYGLIDRSGAWIAEPAWSSVSDFAEGMAAVEKDGKWGYIDASGNIKIDYSYREAGPFGCGRAAVRTASSFGYIDVMGNIAISEKWSSANVFSNDLAFVSLSSKSYIIDKVGKAL